MDAGSLVSDWAGYVCIALYALDWIVWIRDRIVDARFE